MKIQFTVQIVLPTAQLASSQKKSGAKFTMKS